MQQGEISVQEILVIGRETNNSGNLPENILRLIEDLDIMVAKADSDPIEVVPENKF